MIMCHRSQTSRFYCVKTRTYFHYFTECSLFMSSRSLTDRKFCASRKIARACERKCLEYGNPYWNFRMDVTVGPFFWKGLGRSRHVIDRSGLIGLAKGNKLVTAYSMLFHSPAKTCVTKWQTTLTDNALHFSPRKNKMLNYRRETVLQGAL